MSIYRNNIKKWINTHKILKKYTNRNFQQAFCNFRKNAEILTQTYNLSKKISQDRTGDVLCNHFLLTVHEFNSFWTEKLKKMFHRRK